LTAQYGGTGRDPHVMAPSFEPILRFLFGKGWTTGTYRQERRRTIRFYSPLLASQSPPITCTLNSPATTIAFSQTAIMPFQDNQENLLRFMAEQQSHQVIDASNQLIPIRWSEVDRENRTFPYELQVYVDQEWQLRPSLFGLLADRKDPTTRELAQLYEGVLPKWWPVKLRQSVSSARTRMRKVSTRCPHRVF
jgi:hypothetical protein